MCTVYRNIYFIENNLRIVNVLSFLAFKSIEPNVEYLISGLNTRLLVIQKYCNNN